MTLETFFEKFALFADAPGAVAKMRELIMWSAFSGAFSAEERNQPMPEEWAVEGAPTLPAIPSSWKWQRGSEVFDVIRGVSYKKNDASDSPVEGSFPVLRANNIGNGINFDGLIYVPRDNIRDEQFVRRGDILIAMSSGSKKLVGKAAPIVTEFNGAFGAFCGIIRNKSGIPDEVLARYFQSPQYTSWVTAAGRGIGINNLGRGDLDSLPVPTPPLAEQKRIVAKMDELMALCDRLEAQQQERETRHAALARASLSRFAEAPTPANLNFLFHPSYPIPPADLRKSILTLAVQGKLVPQDPYDGDARDLIDCAMKKRQQTIRSKNLRRKDLDESEELISEDQLPASWCVERFANLVDPENTISYGVLVPGSDVASGIPFVRVQDLSINSPARLPNKTIAPEIEKPYARTRLRGGEILLCVVGATIGRLGVAPASWAGANIARAVARIAPIAELHRDYLLLVLRSPLIQSYFATTTRTLAQPTLNVGAIEQTPIPLPPLPEQRRIVTKVDQLMALVDQLESQLAASRATASNLLEALVAELTSAGRRNPAATAAPAKSNGDPIEPDGGLLHSVNQSQGVMHGIRTDSATR